MAGLEPLNLESTLAHLRAQLIRPDGTGYFSVEYGANRAAALAAREFALPALFILSPSYSPAGGGPRNASGLVMHNQQWEVACMTVVANASNDAGNLQEQETTRLRGLLVSAMLTFTPDPGGNQYDAGQGSLLDFDDQVFIYVDTFRLQRHIRS